MSLKLPVYLDYNATTPVDKRVLEKMLPFFTDVFGNAASIDHQFGVEALEAVDLARSQLGKFLGCSGEEIIFTSGATESDNIALFGIANGYAEKGDHIITCQTEHRAVLDAAKMLENSGKVITYLPVDQYGQVNPDDVKKAITPRTILISIMAANNETGTIANIKEIGKIAREHNVIFHTDATQYVGHLPLNVAENYIDLLSFSAHKIYGPKGIGAIYVRHTDPALKLMPIIYGGGHEKGVRSGTLNVTGIVGFGTAASICQEEYEAEEIRLRNLTNKLWEGLSSALKRVELNGHPQQRLPNTLNVSISGIKSKPFIKALGDIAISAGSACSSADVKPSHVISALGFGDERGRSSIRFSLGRYTTEEEIDFVINRTTKVARFLQKLLL